jgi:hypothetical protein
MVTEMRLFWMSSYLLPVSPDAIQSLERQVDVLSSWLVFWTALVVLGLMMEYGSDFAKWKPRNLKNPRSFIWVPIWGITGGILVVGGVAGELYIGVTASRVESHLRDDNHQNEAWLTKEAGDAKNSADAAANAAQRAKDESAKAVSSASNALNLAGDAREEADSVHQEIGKASGQLAQLEAEAQKTKSDLINLALCNAPRVISNWFLSSPAGAKSYVDPLRPMAGQIVFIEVVPDAEPRRAALNIAQTLLDAQWNVQKPLTFVDGLADGVSVQPSVPTFTASAKGEIPNMSPHWHASDVAEKLLDFLHSYNWQAVRGWPTDPQGKPIRDERVLPAGAIRIQVGLYPPAVYVSPPGQKELTSAMGEMRREREKAMAESKRKREERLAALPLEDRKRLQQANEEWEAKIKSETRNGPCQVLNPLF